MTIHNNVDKTFFFFEEVDKTFWVFYFLCVFSDFWHKSKKRLIKNNNVKHLKTNANTQTQHVIQIANNIVCALQMIK